MDLGGIGDELTVDPYVYALAEARLTAQGYTYRPDHVRLAELLQETIESFEDELEVPND